VCVCVLAYQPRHALMHYYRYSASHGGHRGQVGHKGHSLYVYVYVYVMLVCLG
jgi:hypothetical protein